MMAFTLFLFVSDIFIQFLFRRIMKYLYIVLESNLLNNLVYAFNTNLTRWYNIETTVFYLLSGNS